MYKILATQEILSLYHDNIRRKSYDSLTNLGKDELTHKAVSHITFINAIGFIHLYLVKTLTFQNIYLLYKILTNFLWFSIKILHRYLAQ